MKRRGEHRRQSRTDGSGFVSFAGTTSDSCRQRSYPVGYYEILGYGIPDY